ncbi:hypothetical protein [Lysobacter sp. FW306-1B-D06B]|uniref:hypothetical protein n=1 Tax=Lysobacter sp. FW306-1B-D06B TaxID=3140250 RepID=UPI0031402180
MSKPPKIDAEQFGAAIDALTTVMSVMFSMLSSEEERTTMLSLLDRIAATAGASPHDDIRAFVAEATAKSLRGIAEIGEASRLAATGATN